MLYLLDANTLIDANRDYYPLSRVPEFWEWLLDLGERDIVKIPLEIYDEITTGNDDLVDWIKQPEVKSALLLDAEVNVDQLRKVLDEGYANDLSDVEIESIGMDPFLVAYAITEESKVITSEVSASSKKRHNRRVPDVCHSFGVTSLNTFQFIREQNFSTGWNNRN